MMMMMMMMMTIAVAAREVSERTYDHPRLKGCTGGPEPAGLCTKAKGGHSHPPTSSVLLELRSAELLDWELLLRNCQPCSTAEGRGKKSTRRKSA